MPEKINGKELAGYQKKSFALPYNGGEIWFEHLDGIFGFEELVLEKLSRDVEHFTKPSAYAYVCFVFDETEVTEKIIEAVKTAVCGRGKRFLKIAFVGLDRQKVRKFKKDLAGNGFETGFLKGLRTRKSGFWQSRFFIKFCRKNGFPLDKTAIFYYNV